MNRVAVTGLGIISCLGNSISEVQQALRDGRSGIKFVPERKELGFRSALAGILTDISLQGVPKKMMRQMGRGSYLAICAVKQAIFDAGLTEDEIRKENTGIIIGNSGNMREIFEQCDTFYNKNKKLGGNALQRTMASSVSANLSVLLGTRGHCMTVSTACASGANAVGYGYQLVTTGHQRRVICGGVQDGSWAYDCNFDALRVFSGREDDPDRASRPFDKYRDGLVPSAGCGIVILENYESAQARGAEIYAEVIGYATNSDGFDMTIPSGKGSLKCMQMALFDAAIETQDIDYVNAHATSTKVGDAAEAGAIAQLFGRKPYVSSTKSMTGHEIGAAGSNELIYTLLMMRNNFIAPNINIEEIDEDCSGINIVANKAEMVPVRYAMSNSFGFGGVNACLVVKRDP